VSFATVPTRGVTGTDNASVSEALVASVGLPEADALAVAVIYRCCTICLRPLWEHIALRWLTNNDFL
jgi:hypothetical protein